MAVPTISVVLPIYRNAETILPLYRRLCSVLEAFTPEFEILFVNDACPAGSLSILEQLAAEDMRVAALALEQNVGQHRAVMLGLGHARGDWIIIMDADLQDPPEAIPILLTEGQAGFAAVFAGRRGKYESDARLLSSRLFKTTLHLLTGVPSDAGMFMAINKSMREQILTMDGPAPFVVAMVGCAGLPITSLPVPRARRMVGESTYTNWKRMKSGWSAIWWVLIWRYKGLSTRFGVALTITCHEHVPSPDMRFIGARFEHQ